MKLILSKGFDKKEIEGITSIETHLNYLRVWKGESKLGDLNLVAVSEIVEEED